MHIGLYFGTFNPIHKGHLAVAKAMYRQVLFDAVWFVVSPSSPFKDCSQLLDEQKRFGLVSLAIKELPFCLATDIEFNMKRPSYTYLTLRKLKETYPNDTFSIIMGGDNFESIEKWKKYEEIMRNHSIYVYPRERVLQVEAIKNVFYIDMPLLNISSTQIRELLTKGESVEGLLPERIIKIIEKEQLY